MDLLKGLRSYGAFKLRESGSPKISVPPSSKTMRRTPKVFEAQERARGSPSPCQVWWGSDFIRDLVGRPKMLRSLYVCLFVRHTFERQFVCAQFRHDGIGVQKQF